MSDLFGWGRETWGSGAWGQAAPVEVTGVAGTGAVGNVTAAIPKVVAVSGVSATASTSGANVWGLVDTSQTPNWKQIA